MAENTDKFIKRGKEQILQESDVKKIIDDNISGYVDRRLKDIELKFETRIENKEVKTTEILAIFITLFTFISVNVNIFTRADDLYTAIYFMGIMTLCCLILVSVLFLLISSRVNFSAIIIFVLSIIFLSSLLVVAKHIPNWNPKINDIKKENQLIK